MKTTGIRKVDRSRPPAARPIADSPPAPKLLLSVDEAAELLNVSDRFVRALAARGALKLTRLGRRTLVHRDEIMRVALAGDGGVR